MQETYVRALRHFDQFRPGTNFKAWMFTILRNAHLDLCRRRKLRPVTAEIDERAVPDPAPPPLPSMEDFSDRVRDALGRLSPAHRLLLFLCDVEGFTYREIADILGCPMGSVMSGLFNARRRLRKLLCE